MTRFCAVCTSTTGPFVKEPLGKRDALVDVCPKCVGEEVKPRDASRAGRGIVSRDTPSSPVAARIKAHRDRLAARGICTNGEKHGKATRGRMCEACHENNRIGERKRRGVPTSRLRGGA